MASSTFLLLLLTITMVMMNVNGQQVGSASWCVVRSDASFNALQTALDYACGAGADCLPLQPDGLCFLPNTIQAHASYAFNSYYQKRARAPGSCEFSGTATIAQTDPSYGSCVYPSSTSGAGGPYTPTTSVPMTNPNMSSPATSAPIFGGLSPGLSSPFNDNSRASSKELATWFLLFFSSSLLILSIIS
ncbi:PLASMODESMATA CALLOSE-BINDING PROTEIN 1-like [Trifolium pratense]|nr:PLASMODESMATA CALLOSE-BINDING PROTEIN 1-like [Trifolium pratense]